MRFIFNPSTGNLESADNVTSPLKTLGEKFKVAELTNMNTPDLEQSPDSFLRPGETLEEWDVTFRRPNAHGGLQREGFAFSKNPKFEKNVNKVNFMPGNRWKKAPPNTWSMRLYTGTDKNGKAQFKTYTGTKAYLRKIWNTHQKQFKRTLQPKSERIATKSYNEPVKILQGKNKGKWFIQYGGGTLSPKVEKYFDPKKYKNDKAAYDAANKELTDYKNRPDKWKNMRRDLDNKKYPKNWKTPNQFMEWLDKKDLSIKGNPASFANNHGIKTKPNPYAPGSNIYYVGDIDRMKLDEIEKARVKSGTGTDAQKKKWKKFLNIDEMRSFFNKQRRNWLKEWSVPSLERGKLSGTKKLHLGHAGDISREFVRPSNLVYTPEVINTQYIWPIDYRMREIYNEIDKIKNNYENIKKTDLKTGRPIYTDEAITKIRALNNEGKELAKLSKGYKQFSAWDPVTGKTTAHGVVKKMTLDPRGQFEGKTLQDLDEAEKQKLIKLRNKIINKKSNKQIKADIKKFEPQVKKIIAYLNQNKNISLALGNKLNSGIPIDDIALTISKDVKIPVGKVMSGLGKILKIGGAATLPLDVIPFAQSRDLGIKNWGKVGAKNLAQGYLNLPRLIEDLTYVAGEGTWKDFGSKKEEDRFFDYEPSTMGDKATVKALRETSNEEIIETIKNQVQEPDIAYGQQAFDPLLIGDNLEKRIQKALEQKAWADSLSLNHPLVKEEEVEIKETENVFGTQIPMKSITEGFSRDEFLAKGGRVGFADGTAHDDKSDEEILAWIKNQMFELDQGWNTGKSVPGKIMDVARVDNWPYYAARMLRAGMSVAEVSAKLPFVGIELLQKLATQPAFKVVPADTNYSAAQVGLGEKYVEGVDDSWITDRPHNKLEGQGLFKEAFGKLMPGYFADKTGLNSLIEDMEAKMIAQGQSKWPVIAGSNVELGLDVTLPFGYVAAANKYKNLKKMLAPVVSGKSVDNVVEEALTDQGMSRRDFNKLLVTGGVITALKTLGLDKLFKGFSRNPVPGSIKMLERSTSKMPLWFPKFIDKINDKMTYRGDGMWDFKGTEDFLPGFHIERVGDDYYISGKNQYEQDFQITYNAPRWEGDADGAYYNQGDFVVEDSVPVGARPEDVDFDGQVVDEVHDVLGNTREMEKIATGKEIKGTTKGEDAVIEAEVKADQAFDQWRESDDYIPD